jgi:hypothetical protein
MRFRDSDWNNDFVLQNAKQNVQCELYSNVNFISRAIFLNEFHK